MIKCTERYSHGWTDARSIFGHAVEEENKKYGSEYTYNRTWGTPIMPKKKVDAHDYVTEAKDLDIETCRNLWIMKYGEDWIDATELVAQEPLIWEVGNRLYWADLLEHDKSMDKYRCKS